MTDHLAHGGNLRAIAEAAGRAEGEILDFSANINPFGPPPWLGEAIERAAARISAYPDPEASAARKAAAARFGRPDSEFLFADGADSLIFAAPRALGATCCLFPLPSYTGYRRSARRAGAVPIPIPLDPGRGFSLAAPSFLGSVAEGLARFSQGGGCLLFLGSPNNPSGGSAPRAEVERLAAAFPKAFLLVDESFLELARSGESLVGTEAPNVLVAASLTKTWAVPGARAGYLWARADLLARIRAELPAWPLSCFAEEIALRALRDEGFVPRTRRLILAEEEDFAARLGSLPGLEVFRSGANFLLLKLRDREGGDLAAARLLSEGIATRRFKADEGLGPEYLRIAVRTRAENGRLLEVLGSVLGTGGGRA